MRGWRERTERHQTRRLADHGREQIRAIRRAYLAGNESGAAAEPTSPAAGPLDWRGLSWPQLRDLAKRLRGQPVQTKADAIDAIEAADERAFRDAFGAVTKRINHGADR